MTTARSACISGRLRPFFIFAATTLTLATSAVFTHRSLAQHPTNSIRQTLAFEVASIRPHQGPLYKVMDFSSSGPRFRLGGYNLRGLVMEAYNVRNFQVVMPAINEQQDTNYDVVANAPEGTTPTRDEFRRMLQTLLADRFQLKVHIEKRPMPVYSLVVGKGGPKLSPPSEPVHTLHDVKGRNLIVETDSITMYDLANEIWSGFMPDRPVLDRTGLTGTYKLRIEATPEFRINGNPQPDDLSIFTAVQEQLGLKLQPSTGPIDTLVVDSVQKLSEN
jgi:uncharacterized protein (TIGR03435 family)